MKYAVSQAAFQPFSLSNNLKFDLQQFFDDTIIIGQSCWENIWMLKVILHGF